MCVCIHMCNSSQFAISLSLSLSLGTEEHGKRRAKVYFEFSFDPNIIRRNKQ